MERVRVLPELVPVFKVHGVDDEVGMGIVRIAVGTDKNLMARPGAGGEGQRNLMGLDGGELIPRLEGLDVLIEVDSVRLAVGRLGGEKFLHRILPVAVDTGDQRPAADRVRDLLRLHAVAHYALHGGEALLALADVGHRRHALPSVS